MDSTSTPSRAPRLAIVLAAGKGTRMKSDLPKVLFPVAGRPMIDYVLDALEQAGIERVLVVVGYRADDVRAALANRSNVEFVLQTEQLGTGHAVMVGRERFAEHTGPVLIVTGDSPLVQASSLQRLLAEYDGPADAPASRTPPACLIGTLHKPNPFGLGRIVRNAAGEFVGIVEEKDATDEQRRITEVNMSTYVFHGPDLVETLGKLKNDNRQREYYITDGPGILRSAGRDVRALAVLAPCEALSINTVDELAAVEAELRKLGY